MTNQARHSVGFTTEIWANYFRNKFTTLAAYFIIMLALAGSLATNTACAETANTRGRISATAHLNFRIVIPPIVRVKALSQVASITIEQAHIDRGYIDLDAASSLMLTSNSRNGYVISANFDSEILEGMVVKLANQIMHANIGKRTTTMHVDSPVVIDQVVEVGYRLYLKTDLKAGQYHWPVALAFMPNSGCGSY
jgi:hypothetical protein